MAPKVDNRKDQQANMQTIALPDFLVQADAQSVPTSGQSGQMTPSCDQMTPSCDGQLFKNNRKLAEFLNGWPTTQHISYAVKLEQNNIALKAQASGIDKRLLEVVDRTKDIKDQAELADLFVIIDSLKAIEDNFKGTLFGERASEAKNLFTAGIILGSQEYKEKGHLKAATLFTFIGGVKLLETYSNLLNEIALPAPPHGVRQKVAKDNVPPALKKAIKDLSIAIGNDDIKSAKEATEKIEEFNGLYVEIKLQYEDSRLLGSDIDRIVLSGFGQKWSGEDKKKIESYKMWLHDHLTHTKRILLSNEDLDAKAFLAQERNAVQLGLADRYRTECLNMAIGIEEMDGYHFGKLVEAAHMVEREVNANYGVLYRYGDKKDVPEDFRTQFGDAIGRKIGLARDLWEDGKRQEAIVALNDIMAGRLGDIKEIDNYNKFLGGLAEHREFTKAYAGFLAIVAGLGAGQLASWGLKVALGARAATFTGKAVIFTADVAGFTGGTRVAEAALQVQPLWNDNLSNKDNIKLWLHPAMLMGSMKGAEGVIGLAAKGIANIAKAGRGVAAAEDAASAIAKSSALAAREASWAARTIGVENLSSIFKRSAREIATGTPMFTVGLTGADVGLGYLFGENPDVWGIVKQHTAKEAILNNLGTMLELAVGREIFIRPAMRPLEGLHNTKVSRDLLTVQTRIKELKAELAHLGKEKDPRPVLVELAAQSQKGFRLMKLAPSGTYSKEQLQTAARFAKFAEETLEVYDRKAAAINPQFVLVGGDAERGPDEARRFTFKNGDVQESVIPTSQIPLILSPRPLRARTGIHRVKPPDNYKLPMDFEKKLLAGAHMALDTLKSAGLNLFYLNKFTVFVLPDTSMRMPGKVIGTALYGAFPEIYKNLRRLYSLSGVLYAYTWRHFDEKKVEIPNSIKDVPNLRFVVMDYTSGGWLTDHTTGGHVINAIKGLRKGSDVDGWYVFEDAYNFGNTKMFFEGPDDWAVSHIDRTVVYDGEKFEFTGRIGSPALKYKSHPFRPLPPGIPNRIAMRYSDFVREGKPDVFADSEKKVTMRELYWTQRYLRRAYGLLGKRIGELYREIIIDRYKEHYDSQVPKTRKEDEELLSVASDFYKKESPTERERRERFQPMWKVFSREFIKPLMEAKLKEAVTEVMDIIKAQLEEDYRNGLPVRNDTEPMDEPLPHRARPPARKSVSGNKEGNAKSKLGKPDPTGTTGTVLSFAGGIGGVGGNGVEIGVPESTKTNFKKELARYNERLAMYDGADGARRARRPLTPEQETTLANSELQEFAKERANFVASHYIEHELSSAANPDSPTAKHLEAHTGTIDLGSDISFGEAEVFKNPSGLISFAEGLLTQAYKGQIQPGTELDLPVASQQKSVKANIRFASSNEIADGVSVGSSISGGRVVLRIVFNRSIGKDGIVELRPEDQSIPVSRKSGGREETVNLVNGKKKPTNVLYVIGGSYGPTGTFGLYTVFSGQNAPPMSDTEFWGRHAFVTGDTKSFEMGADGRIRVFKNSNLGKMASGEEPKVALLDNVAEVEGEIVKASDEFIDRLVRQKMMASRFMAFLNEILRYPKNLTDKQRSDFESYLATEQIEKFRKGKLDASQIENNNVDIKLLAILTPEQKQSVWNSTVDDPRRNRFYERKRAELAGFYSAVSRTLNELKIDPKEQHFVDIAGGAGDVGRILSTTFKGSSSELLDFDPKQLTFASDLDKIFNQDVNGKKFNIRNEKIPDGVWVAKHPCGDLVEHIIAQWVVAPNSPVLIIMTCCQGQAKNYRDANGDPPYGFSVEKWEELCRKSDWTSHPNSEMCKEGYRTMDELDNARVRYLRERGYKVKLVKINGTSKGNLIVASRTTKPKNSGVGGNGVEVEGAEGDEEPHKTE